MTGWSSNCYSIRENRPGKKTYRPDIDGLRAIAVIAVVIFHAFPNTLSGGFIGVDVFFVISGYLISGIILSSAEKGTFSYFDFYARRVRRIFPTLLIVLLACLLAGWYRMLPADYELLGKHVTAGAGFVSNFILWRESGYFDAAAESKPLLHLWSLAIEEQFYIVWPLLIVIAYKRSLGAVALLALGVFGLTFSANVFQIASDPIGTFYLPQTRFFELATGCILQCLVRQHSTGLDTKASNLLASVGLVLILATAFFLSKTQSFPGGLALLPVGGAFLVIAAGANCFVNQKVIGNRILVSIGLISFPLYLWHWPLLYFLRHVESDITQAVLRGGAVIAAFILATLTYHFIEKPLRYGSRLKLKTTGLCLGMVVVGVIGIWIVQNSGISQRFPPLIQGIISLKYDTTAAYREKTCFLKENNESVFGDCVSGAKDAASPSLFLWGDSHAAHLYPGISHTFASTHRITQLTSGGCPPILNYAMKERPNCISINNEIFERIKKERPTRVIMSAVWSNHRWHELAATIKKLKSLGIKEIQVVGPVPIWQDSLPKNLYGYFLRNHQVPTRMTYGLSMGSHDIDREFRVMVTSLGATYISAWDILCNTDGCLTRLSDNPESLTAWDYGHLTVEGSHYLVAHFPK